MKILLSVPILLGLASSANATVQGYYYFFFNPDDPGQEGYYICSFVHNEGPKSPFVEHGHVRGITPGPYGAPSGEYNFVAQGADNMAIYMANSPLDNTPQYQYFLVGSTPGNTLDHVKHGRYVISVSTQPPPPKRGDARRGSKPGAYTIVETGALKITASVDNGCP
jgi:hypothetical protein